jgi:hypothetical protein
MDFEKKIKPLAVVLVLASVLLVLLALAFKSPLKDPDLGWHLTNGYKIFYQGSFTLKDTYTWTMPGYFYADSWWLTEVLVVGLLPWLSWGGLALFFTVIGVGTLLILTLSLQNWQQRPGTISGLVLVGGLLAGPIIGARAQTLSFLFFSLLWLALRKLFVAPRPPVSVPWWGYFLPGYFMVWANFHAGWVLGFALMSLVLGIEVLRFVMVRLSNYRGWITSGLSAKDCFAYQRVLLRLLILGTLCLLATLINPYGLQLHRSIWQDASSPLIKNNIAEWLAPNLHDDFGLLLVFWTGLVGAVLIGRGKKGLRPVEAAVLLFGVFNALTAIRNATYLVSVTLPLLVDNLKEIKLPKVIFGFPSFQALFWPLLTMAYFGKFFLPNLDKYQSLAELAQDAKMPVRSLRYIRDYSLGSRVFNEYAWGGLMIWKLSGHKTFIDGRMPGWEAAPTAGGRQAKSRAVFESYINISDLKDDFEKEIKRWGIDWFWVRKDVKISAWLRVNPDWQLIFEDQTASIFVPSSP